MNGEQWAAAAGRAGNRWRSRIDREWRRRAQRNGDIAESPLGWLLARGFVSQRQYDAGERLRGDWERAQRAPRVTMAWDSAPVARGRGGSPHGPDLVGSQIDAKRRFDDAIASAGSGLADILWRVVCAGEGMRDAETALGWPARAGKLVLSFALDRIADYYRVR